MFRPLDQAHCSDKYLSKRALLWETPVCSQSNMFRSGLMTPLHAALCLAGGHFQEAQVEQERLGCRGAKRILTGRQLMDGALQGSRYESSKTHTHKPLPGEPSDRVKSVVANAVRNHFWGNMIQSILGLFKPRFLLSASQKAHKTRHIAGHSGCEQRSQPRFLFCLMAPLGVVYGYVFWNNMGFFKPAVSQPEST